MLHDSCLSHTFLHREEGNSSHITDTAYWLVRPLYSVYSLIAKLQDPFQLLGKFEFDGHRTHEHAVTHRSL